MIVINKNGVYSLIYNVKSQRGKNARDWIIQNVIPELYENTGLSALNYPPRNERSSEMSSNLKVFENTEFGNIQTVEENGKVLFVGTMWARL